MGVSCTCQDWKEGHWQIYSAAFLASIHGQMYTGKVFRFCPWCGLTLVVADVAPQPATGQAKDSDGTQRG